MERVDAFKLVVYDPRFDKRVDIILGIIDEIFEISQVVSDGFFSNRRSINGFSKSVCGDRSGDFSDSALAWLDDISELHKEIRMDKTFFLDKVEPVHERILV